MKMRNITFLLLIVLSSLLILNPTTSFAQVNYIYWVSFTGNKIQRAHLDGSNVQDIVTGFGRPVDIALDIASGKMYWTDRDRIHAEDPTGKNSINRANLDGTNIETLVSGGNSVKEYIMLALSNGKMYWTDWTVVDNANAGKIQRANLDGSNIEDLVTGLSAAVRGIALDIPQGKMYWTDKSKIQCANLAGSNIQDVVEGINTPHGIALDVVNGKIYWTDWEMGKIQRANLDGSNLEDIVVDLSQPFGIALDHLSGKVYWTDNVTGKIQRANLDGTNVEDIVTGLTHPIGIALGIPQPSDERERRVADATLRLSPSPVQSPAVGQQLTLNLNITGGENVAGYQATVHFDTTALRYVSSTIGDYLPPEAFVVPPVVKTGAVTLGATSIGGESEGDGTLATITFEVVNAKASTVTLSEVLLANMEGSGSRPQVEAAEIIEPQGLKADVNSDGVVNIQDLVLVAANFGQTGENTADVNNDGVVNIIDLTLVAAALGETAAAPSVHAAVLEHLTATEVAQWLRAAQQANLTDPAFQRGVEVLKHLLTVLVPKETALLPNYPNPFNPETWIPYHLAAPAEVTLTIYSADGKLVRTLALGHQAAGIYQSKSRAAYWDGRNDLDERVASGLYFHVFTAGDFTATGKMLVLK